jgi:hypothetical protein
MGWYYLEKEFYDYADDIEGVNIHYVWTPLGGTPDWEKQRATRYMPLVRPTSQVAGEAGANVSSPGVTGPVTTRLRKKVLKLPALISDPQSNTLTDRYILHHYFEIFQDGHRHYSPLYTQEVITGTGTPPAAAEERGTAQSEVAAQASPKES